MNRCPLTLCIIGIFLITGSIILPIVFSIIFEDNLIQSLILKPDSDILQSFKKTPIPIYLQFYMFNLTNENDVLQGAKPRFTQLGPYTYRIQIQREDIKFNHTAGTVFSKSRKYYYFEPSLTNGSESDVIVTINIVFIILAEQAKTEIIKGMAQLWFLRFHLNPFMTRTVGEMLFSGFEEPLLKLLYPKTKLESHRRGKAGFYYLKNGTIDSETDIITGELGMDNYQKIVKLNGKRKLNYWKTERCNTLNGTEGSQFARPVTKNQHLYLFAPSLCRSVYFSYDKDITLGPLELRRFTMPPEMLRQGEENNCYCPNDFTCRSSIIDLTACVGVPMIVSTPHFLDGDFRDIDAVVGLNPVKEEHQTFLDIEPNTGVTMRGAKRVQMNMPLRRYANFPVLANITEIIFPIFWINESAVVPLDMAQKFHFTLTVPFILMKYCIGGLFIVGLLLILVAFIITRKVLSPAKLQKQQQSNEICQAMLYNQKIWIDANTPIFY